MALGSWLKVVAGVVLMATGVGVVAGAMMLASAAADFGIIGGSVGKFLKSSTFQYMTMAVGLASAATSMYGASAGAAGSAASAGTAQSANTVVGAAGQTAVQDTAIVGQGMQDAAATNASFLQSAGLGPDIAATAAHAQVSESTSGLTQANVNAANGDIGSQFGANPEGASAAETSQAGGGSPLVGKPVGAPAGTDVGGAPTMGANTMPATPGPTLDANGMASATQPGIPNTTTPSAAMQPGAGAPASSGGFLNNALGMIDKHPGLATVGGQMLSGMGQGIGQKQAMEDMIKAQQWGNMQWQNKGQVDKLQAAAAAPITVPQGYLQRAAQARALVQGNSGIQPLPAASPGAPLAPSPVHI